MRSKAMLAAAVLLWSSTMSATASKPEAPVAVSPGNSLAPVPIDSRCPNFYWGTVAGVRAFDLAVYRLGTELGDAEPVLQQRLPGSASSWTPDLARCLENGGRYAWSVRAVGDRLESEWSDLRLFELTAEPTRLEVERALWILRRYLASEGEEPWRSGRSSEDVVPESLVLPTAAATGSTRTRTSSPWAWTSSLRGRTATSSASSTASPRMAVSS
jgi:hypothetical protein